MSPRPFGLALCLIALVASAQEEPNDAVPPKVLAIYDEGKAAYDAKSFETALERFDRCVELEPSRARWHYNRGLTLKKLGRDSDAREAFADSQRMDPEYKKVEIGKKLAELGGAPATSSTTVTDVDGDLTLPICGLGCLGAVVGLFLIIRAWRKKSPEQAAQPPSAEAADWNALIAAHAKRAERIAPLEHAQALGPDPAVTRAGDELQFARRLLFERRDPEAVKRCGERADQGLSEAAQRSGGRGERVGCFFCARPLAARASRRGVTLNLGAGETGVVACERCATKASSGAPLTVRTVEGAHWASSAAFDPYLHAYWGGPTSDEVPVWKAGLEPAQVQSIAPVVGLGVVAAGVAAVAVLDLAAAREAGLAAEAAAAAARHATGGSPSSSQLRDHS